MPYQKVFVRILCEAKRVACYALMAMSFGVAAQQSGVTLYGIIDLGIEYDRVRLGSTPGAPPLQELNQSFFGVTNGVQSGSRWGLRGVESLGRGVAVNFVLEGGFNPAQGTAAQGGRLFGRQSTLGISMREIGQLDFGRQINLASNYFLSIDPFGEGFGQANIGASFGSTNTSRYDNSLILQVIPVQGLTLGAGYSFSTDMSAIYAGEASCITLQTCTVQAGRYGFTSQNNMRALTLGAQYRRGPLDVAIAYDQFYGDHSQQVGQEGPSAWVLGGSYDFRIVKLSLVVGRSLNGFANGQASGTAATNSGLPVPSGVAGGVLFLPGAQASSYMVGLTAPLGSHTTLLASWQMMQPQGILSENVQFKAQQIYSAALTQQLSPRTNLYTYVSYGQNYAMVSTAESFVMGVGVRHTF